MRDQGTRPSWDSFFERSAWERRRRQQEAEFDAADKRYAEFRAQAIDEAIRAQGENHDPGDEMAILIAEALTEAAR